MSTGTRLASISPLHPAVKGPDSPLGIALSIRGNKSLEALG